MKTGSLAGFSAIGKFNKTVDKMEAIQKRRIELYCTRTHLLSIKNQK